MSGEKIDIEKIATDAARMVALFGPTATYRGNAVQMLALVAAVRAARALNDTPASVNNWKALDAALAPFTDSAEVRGDD